MNIILPKSTPQSIEVYLRDFTSTDFILMITDEETNVKYTTEMTGFSFSDFDEELFTDFDGEVFSGISEILDFSGKASIEFAHDFKEGRFYMLEITSDKLLYRGKLYCTAQTGQYAVSGYTKPTGNKNEFIVKA